MSMTGIESAKKILRDAEQALQQLLARAAVEGDYASIGSLAYWAQQVGNLIGNTEDIAEPCALGCTAEARQSRRTKRKPAPTRCAAGYPRFVRDDDYLVKIGWSKKDNGEYEHKAHRHVVQALVSCISRIGRNGVRFSMESMLPLRGFDGEVIPNYQSYLVLAWLRVIEAVKQHGRLGYTIGAGIEIVDAVDDCWNRLPSRSFAESEKG